MSEMLLREAIQILAVHAARDCAGTGCGIRSLPSREENAQVVRALHRVWFRVHGHTMTDNEAFNLGLPGIPRTEEEVNP